MDKIFKRDTIQRIAALNSKGQEIPDQRNLFIPGLREPESIQEQIKRILRLEIAKQAKLAEFEDMDEAEDFDVDDDFDSKLPDSRYELLDDDDPAPPPRKVKKPGKEAPTKPEPAPNPDAAPPPPQKGGEGVPK